MFSSIPDNSTTPLLWQLKMSSVIAKCSLKDKNHPPSIENHGMTILKRITQLTINKEQVHMPENECPDVFNFSFRYTLSEILVANIEETSSYLSSGYSKV